MKKELAFKLALACAFNSSCCACIMRRDVTVSSFGGKAAAFSHLGQESRGNEAHSFVSCGHQPPIFAWHLKPQKTAVARVVGRAEACRRDQTPLGRRRQANRLLWNT